MDRVNRVSLKPMIIISMVAAAAACTPESRAGTFTEVSPTAVEANDAGRLPASASTVELESGAFKQGTDIPDKYTCDGENISPQLAWQNLPENSTHLVLVVDDPDAPKGSWIHWLVFNIPAGIDGLPEGLGADPALRGLGSAGLNSWGEPYYGGPCPPSGTHRYFFRLYALDEELSFTSPPSISELQQAMVGHIMADASLVGLYARGDS